MATSADPEKQLAAFIDRYTPDVARLGRESRARLEKLVPGATQLVYDNYNALVIGFAPAAKASEAVLSIALYPRWVTLFFLRGAGLADPEGLLEGTGSTVRGIRLRGGVEDLDRPAVKKLIAAAWAQAGGAGSDTKPGPLVIKSVSAKQRPRRPA